MRIRLSVSLFLLWCACAFMVCGCSEERVVAKLNGITITAEEYIWEINNLPESMRSSLKTIDDRKEFIRKLMHRKLLLEEAIRQDIDDDDDMQYKIENSRRAILINELLERQFEKLMMVTETEIKEYYQTNQDQFTKETVEASHILVKKKEDAEMILALIKKGENFANLARRFSIGPEASAGGNLGIVTRGQMPPKLEEVIFSLPKRGDISPIVETEFGYHIIHIEKPKAVAIQPYEEVRETIRTILTEEKKIKFLENYLNDLKKGMEIEINEEALKKIG